MILREVAGEYILVPVGSMALKLHGMISLTESGCLLWRMLEAGADEQALTDGLLREYDTDAATARQDVEAFLQKLASLGILN